MSVERSDATRLDSRPLERRSDLITLEFAATPIAHAAPAASTPLSSHDAHFRQPPRHFLTARLLI